MDISRVQGMTKLQISGIYASILILITSTYYFVDATILLGNSTGDTGYKAVTFDSLSTKDLDLIAAVKEDMKLVEE